MNNSIETSLDDFNNDIYRCQAYIYRHLDSSRHHLNKNWTEYKKITDAIFKEIGDVTKNITQYCYRGNVLSTSMPYEHDIFKLPDVHDVVKKVLIDLVKTLKYHINHHYPENKWQGTIDEFRYRKL